MRAILHVPSIQPKLKLGAVNDPAEAEADRVAESVMRMAEPQSSAAAPAGTGGSNVVRRVCTECQEELARKPADTVQRMCAHCGEELGGEAVRRLGEDDEETLQAKEQPGSSRATAGAAETAAAALSGSGLPLPASERAFFEPRFGRSFADVRVHAGAAADSAARSINARAYTLGRDIGFAAGEYVPGSPGGRLLIAHELTHTLQRRGTGHTLRRVTCTAAAACAAPIPGNPEEFSTSETAIEASPRARRRTMTPARARSSGHAGRARQLENILNTHSAAQRAAIHGIFIDQDMSSGTGAMVTNCASWRVDALPAGDPDPHGMAAAVKPCVFVHGQLNQEALRFNFGEATVGGKARDAWRADALGMLIHEAEHVRFGTIEPGLALPAGVTTPTCTKANVEFSLSEIVAILSEFPLHFDAANAEANPAGPAHGRLTVYLANAVSNPSESLEGALLHMGCECDCPEIDLLVIQAVDAMTTGFTAAQETALRTELQTLMPSPTRPFWPAAPTP